MVVVVEDDWSAVVVVVVGKDNRNCGMIGVVVEKYSFASCSRLTWR